MIYHRPLVVVALFTLFPALLVGIAFAGQNATGERPAPTYLRQTGDGRWQRLADTGTGLKMLDPDVRAPFNVNSPVRPGAADSFGFPPSVYDVGSWPEAVAIGDVNADGRNDVVMVTSTYFDAANDYHLLRLSAG